jgi:hypothetical protein
MKKLNRSAKDGKQVRRHSQSQSRKSAGKEKLRTIWVSFDNRLIAAADEVAAKLGLTREQLIIRAIEERVGRAGQIGGAR